MFTLRGGPVAVLQRFWPRVNTKNEKRIFKNGLCEKLKSFSSRIHGYALKQWCFGISPFFHRCLHGLHCPENRINSIGYCFNTVVYIYWPYCPLFFQRSKRPHVQWGAPTRIVPLYHCTIAHNPWHIASLYHCIIASLYRCSQTMTHCVILPLYHCSQPMTHCVIFTA